MNNIIAVIIGLAIGMIFIYQVYKDHKMTEKFLKDGKL